VFNGGKPVYRTVIWSHEMRPSLYLVEFPQPDFGEMYLFLQREKLQKRAWGERKEVVSNLAVNQFM